MRPLAILSLLLAPTLLAQKEKPATPPPPPATGHITGTVFCNDTHRPARGALVMLVPLGPEKDAVTTGFTQALSRTALDGTYHFDHVAAGNFTVLAFYAGYALPFNMEDLLSMNEKNPGSESKVFLRENGVATIADAGSANFDITLQRGASLSGRVLYSDGSPAAQVALDIQDASQKSSTNTNSDERAAGAFFGHMFTHQNLTTDDLGNFRIAGLRAGKYRLAATEPGSRGDEKEEAMGAMLGVVDPSHVLHIYAGNTLHQADAKLFELRPGDDLTGVDITIPLDTFRRVNGTVTALDGRPVNLGELTLTDSTDPQTSFHTTLNKSNTFAFDNVPPGTYTLEIKAAHIGKPADPNPKVPGMERYMPLKPTNAFADDSKSILIKNSDITDANLALKEIPMPKSGPSTVNNPIGIPPEQ